MAPKAPSIDDILEFLSRPAGRVAVLDDTNCPVVMSKHGNLYVRRKSRSYPAGARKADVVEWATLHVPGFTAWFHGDQSPAPSRSASRPARLAPEPESSDDERVPEHSDEEDQDMSDEDEDEDEFDEVEPEPQPDEDEDEAYFVPAKPAKPSRSDRSHRSKPAQSASVSEVPLFPENRRIRTKSFYAWLLEFGFIQFNADTGAFAFEPIPSKGLHQRVAKERGFDIGRRFTAADCKAAAARKWGLSPDTRIPDRGTLDDLREKARLTGRALEDALRLEREQARMSKVTI